MQDRTKRATRLARSERIGIRLPPGITARMRTAAAEDEKSLTDWLETLIRAELERVDEKRR